MPEGNGEVAMAQPHTVIKVGYEQFVPPPVPLGMWFDSGWRAGT